MPGGRHGSSGGGGVHRARARIHPHVKHTRSSSEAQKIKGHSTHSTEATRSTLYARKLARDTRDLQWRDFTNDHHVRQLQANWHKRGDRPPRPRSPLSPFACRCRTYFLHSNFSSTIFMFEEYLGESEIYALIDTYYLGIFYRIRGVFGSCYNAITVSQLPLHGWFVQNIMLNKVKSSWYKHLYKS